MRRAGLALALCLALSACGGGPGTGTPASYASYPPGQDGTSPRAVPAPNLAQVKADPLRLKGVSAIDARALLGEPDFLRREKPAEVWQYYGQDCVLDLFVYGEGANQIISYVDLRARGKASTPDPGCLRTLSGGRG